MDKPIITENNKGKGAIKWVQTSRAEKSVGSVLLGRGVALYDYCMDHRTDLSVLVEDLHERMVRFRNITIWTGNENNKVRKAWTAICYDHPGKGMDDVMGADVTLSQLEKWYAFETEGLETATILNEGVYHLWDKDYVQTAVDLCIPHKTLLVLRNWATMPGQDVIRIARYAVDAVGGLDALKDVQNNLGLKDAFVMAWRYAEDKLLDEYPGRRDKVEL